MDDDTETDIPLDELPDDQLEVEASDLRNDIEAIALDLMDDARGDFYRGKNWRIRARAARAYKHADLNAINVILKLRRDKRESEEAAERKASALAAHMAQLEMAAVRAREKTERHRISEARNLLKDRILLRVFRRTYGIEAYQALVEAAMQDKDWPIDKKETADA